MRERFRTEAGKWGGSGKDEERDILTTELRGQIQRMSKKMEEQERKERKNRIVIKGLKLRDGKDCEKVGNFLESEFKAKKA